MTVRLVAGVALGFALAVAPVPLVHSIMGASSMSPTFRSVADSLRTSSLFIDWVFSGMVPVPAVPLSLFLAT